MILSFNGFEFGYTIKVYEGRDGRIHYDRINPYTFIGRCLN